MCAPDPTIHKRYYVFKIDGDSTLDLQTNMKWEHCFHTTQLFTSHYEAVEMARYFASKDGVPVFVGAVDIIIDGCYVLERYEN